MLNLTIYLRHFLSISVFFIPAFTFQVFHASAVIRQTKQKTRNFKTKLFRESDSQTGGLGAHLWQVLLLEPQNRFSFIYLFFKLFMATALAYWTSEDAIKSSVLLEPRRNKNLVFFRKMDFLKERKEITEREREYNFL